MLFYICFLASNLLYQWYDETGVLYFSDRYHEQASHYVIVPTQTYTPRDIESEITEVSVDAATYYQTIVIAQPEHDATLRDNQGRVAIAARVQPKLRGMDKLLFFLDGQSVGEPQRGLTLVLNNIDRGTHYLFAQIVTEDDAVLAQSDTITFYLHRARVS